MIRISAGSTIIITFVDFDVDDSGDCAHDYLDIQSIIDGYPHKWHKLCSNRTFPPYYSMSNIVRIYFHSNVMTSSRGFHLRYKSGISS